MKHETQCENFQYVYEWLNTKKHEDLGLAILLDLYWFEITIVTRIKNLPTNVNKPVNWCELPWNKEWQITKKTQKSNFPESLNWRL